MLSLGMANSRLELIMKTVCGALSFFSPFEKLFALCRVEQQHRNMRSKQKLKCFTPTPPPPTYTHTPKRLSLLI
jgi:hypothetical protein